MARYIDADAYLQSIRPHGVSDYVWKESEIYKSMNAFPTIDFIERKRGTWIPAEGHIIPIFKCSQCNTLSLGGNYCPNCGADMRGENGERRTDESD